MVGKAWRLGKGDLMSFGDICERRCRVDVCNVWSETNTADRMVRVASTFARECDFMLPHHPNVYVAKVSSFSIFCCNHLLLCILVSNTAHSPDRHI
jgi:hypothetical protein